FLQPRRFPLFASIKGASDKGPGKEPGKSAARWPQNPDIGKPRNGDAKRQPRRRGVIQVAVNRLNLELVTSRLLGSPFKAPIPGDAGKDGLARRIRQAIPELP